jgi:hypothetical protein
MCQIARVRLHSSCGAARCRITIERSCRGSIPVRLGQHTDYVQSRSRFIKGVMPIFSFTRRSVAQRSPRSSHIDEYPWN